jgi:hypothetical protein
MCPSTKGVPSIPAAPLEASNIIRISSNGYAAGAGRTAAGLEGGPEIDIVDRLNAQAKRLAAKSDCKPGDEDYDCLEMVKEGATVFKHRIWPLMYLYWAYIVYGMCTAPSLPFFVGAFVATYLYIDLYGAILRTYALYVFICVGWVVSLSLSLSLYNSLFLHPRLTYAPIFQQTLSWTTPPSFVYRSWGRHVWSSNSITSFPTRSQCAPIGTLLQT